MLMFKLGLQNGLRSVDLEKNGRIRYPFAFLFTMTCALWWEWRELVNIV
jgi:hypothetical protein